MKKPIKITKTLCNSCKYSIRFSGGQDYELRQGIACNYILDTEYSRIFENGEMRFPANYCDKYEPKNGSERTRRKTAIKRRRKKDEA